VFGAAGAAGATAVEVAYDGRWQPHGTGEQGVGVDVGGRF
jgi:hypothetical protein